MELPIARRCSRAATARRVALNLPTDSEGTATQSVAAYYLLVASELAIEQQAKARRFDRPVPRRSLVERIGSTLETLVRFGRPGTTQPI